MKQGDGDHHPVSGVFGRTPILEGPCSATTLLLGLSLAECFRGEAEPPRSPPAPLLGGLRRANPTAALCAGGSPAWS